MARPDAVAAVVGVLAVGAPAFLGAFVPSAPSTETAAFVLLWVVGPTTVAYEAARRWPYSAGRVDSRTVT